MFLAKNFDGGGIRVREGKKTSSLVAAPPWVIVVEKGVIVLTKEIKDRGLGVNVGYGMETGFGNRKILPMSKEYLMDGREFGVESEQFIYSGSFLVEGKDVPESMFGWAEARKN